MESPDLDVPEGSDRAEPVDLDVQPRAEPGESHEAALTHSQQCRV